MAKKTTINEKNILSLIVVKKLITEKLLLQ